MTVHEPVNGRDHGPTETEDRMEDVRWLVSTAREEFPGIFDDLDEFMRPRRINYDALRAGYGPYHGDHVQMVKLILLDYHGVTREEIETVLSEPSGGNSTH